MPFVCQPFCKNNSPSSTVIPIISMQISQWKISLKRWINAALAEATTNHFDTQFVREKKGKILIKQKSTRKLLTASNVITKHIEPINTDNDFYQNSFTPGKTR